MNERTAYLDDLDVDFDTVYDLADRVNQGNGISTIKNVGEFPLLSFNGELDSSVRFTYFVRQPDQSAPTHIIDIYNSTDGTTTDLITVALDWTLLTTEDTTDFNSSIDLGLLSIEPPGPPSKVTPMPEDNPGRLIEPTNQALLKKLGAMKTQLDVLWPFHLDIPREDCRNAPLDVTSVTFVRNLTESMAVDQTSRSSSWHDMKDAYALRVDTTGAGNPSNVKLGRSSVVRYTESGLPYVDREIWLFSASGENQYRKGKVVEKTVFEMTPAERADAKLIRSQQRNAERRERNGGMDQDVLRYNMARGAVLLGKAL